MSTSEESPAALNHRAEELLADEKWEEGLALLGRALDLEPTFVPAIDSLGIVAAMLPGAHDDELFARLATAESSAATPEERERFRWYRLCHLAFHGREDALRELANTAQFTDEERAAGLAALRLEQGDARAAAALSEARARIGQSRGRAAILEQLIAASRSLTEGEPTAREAVREAARAAIARAESQDELGPHLMSELIVLKIQLALDENHPADARDAARDLGLPPERHDPGAMLRAARLVGPLTALAD